MRRGRIKNRLLRFILIILVIMITDMAFAKTCGYIAGTWYCLTDEWINTESINWDTLDDDLNSKAINWDDITDEVNNSMINWDDQNLQSSYAVCWTGTKLGYCSNNLSVAGTCTCN